MNKLIITGRIIRDPEIKTTSNGTEYCNMTVAVDRRIRKGEEKQADFFACTAWGKTAAFLKQYFKKGDGITIDGRIESRKFIDKDGNNRVAWGVQIDNVEFPLGKSKQNDTDWTDEADRAEEISPSTISDEVLPF